MTSQNCERNITSKSQILKFSSQNYTCHFYTSTEIDPLDVAKLRHVNLNFTMFLKLQALFLSTVVFFQTTFIAISFSTNQTSECFYRSVLPLMHNKSTFAAEIFPTSLTTRTGFNGFVPNILVNPKSRLGLEALSTVHTEFYNRLVVQGYLVNLIFFPGPKHRRTQSAPKQLAQVFDMVGKFWLGAEHGPTHSTLDDHDLAMAFPTPGTNNFHFIGMVAYLKQNKRNLFNSLKTCVISCLILSKHI